MPICRCNSVSPLAAGKMTGEQAAGLTRRCPLRHELRPQCRPESGAEQSSCPAMRPARAELALASPDRRSSLQADLRGKRGRKG